jgi:signal transduction histidine kinase
MSDYFPNFLRAIISCVATVLLLTTLLQPKYSKKVTLITTLSTLAVILATAAYCYLSRDLTFLAKIDLVLATMICFAIRPVFKESFMQFLFSYLTVQNISEAVVVLSFIGSRKLPYPIYANSILRFLLLGSFSIILYRYVRPLYRQAVEHWTAYFAVAMSIYITFAYYVLSSDDIVRTLTEEAVPLILIIIIGISAYASIFLSLKNLQREFKIKEENHKMQAEREYLQLAANDMSERLKLIEEVSAQNMRASHDRRHFNNMILELLEEGKKQEVISLLKKQSQDKPKKSRIYCENHVVNAAVCHYAGIAEKSSIQTNIELDIPCELHVDSIELSMVVSNLLENAIEACTKQSDSKLVYINFICRNLGRLVLEIENPCTEGTTLDKDGYPVTHEKDHGIGSKSVVAFAKKYDCELLYRIDNGVFRVRMLI